MKYIAVTVSAAALIIAGQAYAAQLVYAPKNPTFGGNPNNGSFLLSTAQTQGFGVKSGQASASPDLSGLEEALGNLGNVGGGTGSGSSPIIIIGNGTTPANP